MKINIQDQKFKRKRLCNFIIVITVITVIVIAVNLYFSKENSQDLTSRSRVSDEAMSASRYAGASSLGNDSDSTRVRILSWNIDGLDHKDLRVRTNAVCDVIEKEKPHVVFIQELIAESQGILEERLTSYKLVPAASGGYYTAALLSKKHVLLAKYEILPFPTSRMSRNLLDIVCTVNDVAVRLLVSHLESTAEHRAERLKQLKYTLDEMKNTPPGITVVFGGDLNLKDSEVKDIGDLPADIHDVWEVTGARPIARYTWDMARNDNLQIPGPRKPKFRFDRLLTYHQPDPRSRARLEPVYFELVGLERVKGCSCFPSDHWGILAHFDIVLQR